MQSIYDRICNERFALYARNNDELSAASAAFYSDYSIASCFRYYVKISTFRGNLIGSGAGIRTGVSVRLNYCHIRANFATKMTETKFIQMRS